MLAKGAWVAAGMGLLASCSGHATHPAGPTPAARCPPAAGRIDGVRVQLRDPVCGSVDGEPGRETVGIALLRGQPAERSVWLAVRFADHTVASPLQTETWREKPSEAQGAPHTFVNGLAAIDRRPGLEIVVTVEEGASTAFGQIFTIEHGALRRIWFPAVSGEFAYEGSVTHFDVIDCLRPASGRIRSSGYGWDGHSGYVQDRTLYQIEDGRLVRVGRETSHETMKTVGRGREFAEPQPFPHCMVVRSRRTY